MTPRPIARALPRLALLALVWCTLTGGVFSGCHGLFTPVTPERPTSAPVIPNYRRPDLTLQTMIEAIQAKDQGADAWVGAIADSSAPADGPGFHLIIDPDDLLVCNCDNPTNWRRTDERQFYLEFMNLSVSAAYVAIFDSVDATPDPQPTDTQALLYRRYQVLATEEDGNTSIIAVGYADLTFTKISTDRWLITRWVDHVDPLVGANPIDPEQRTLGRRRLR
jgi:hypothetical protein